jgi:hypothetical protein
VESEGWKLKVNEGKTQATYFSRRYRVPEDKLQLTGWNISLVDDAKKRHYLR